jgi:hypothetical protein
VKIGGEEFREDPFMELDYEYTFTKFTSLENLKSFFVFGSGSTRRAPAPWFGHPCSRAARGPTTRF